MNKKFFTLIKDTDSIHVSPNTKIIKADAISKLLEAVEVLEKAKKDAEAHIEDANKETVAIKETARKEGYEAGLKEWAEKLVKLEEEIIKVRKDTEKVVIPVALKAAKKILGRELENVDTAIVDIVQTSLKAVAQHKKFTIYVNRKDLDILEANRPALKKVLENPEAFSIRERADIQPGGCIIETEGGIINAQLDNQWRILEQAFEGLLRQQGPTHK